MKKFHPQLRYQIIALLLMIHSQVLYAGFPSCSLLRALVEYNGKSLQLPESLVDVFAASRSNKEIYEPGRCHENTQRFLNAKEIPQELKSNFRILVFGPRTKATNLVQFHVRDQEFQGTADYVRVHQHVVAEYNRYIFDLSAKDPIPVPIEYYFETMFQHVFHHRQSYGSPKYDYTNDIIVSEITGENKVGYLSEINSLSTFKWLFKEQNITQTLDSWYKTNAR